MPHHFRTPDKSIFTVSSGNWSHVSAAFYKKDEEIQLFPVLPLQLPCEAVMLQPFAPAQVTRTLCKVQVFALLTKGQPRHHHGARSDAQISLRTHACLFKFLHYRGLIHLQLNPQEIPQEGDSHPKKHFVWHWQRFPSFSRVTFWQIKPQCDYCLKKAT